MARHLIVHKAGVTWPFCARVPTSHAEGVVHAYRDDQNYPTTGITCKWCLKKLGGPRTEACQPRPVEPPVSKIEIRFNGQPPVVLEDVFQIVYATDGGGVVISPRPDGSVHVSAGGTNNLIIAPTAANGFVVWERT